MNTQQQLQFVISDIAMPQEEEFIIDSLWQHNNQFTSVDIVPLRVTARDEQDQIIAGLVARTWWGGLDIQYLWVAEAYRKIGVGRSLMQQAEQEAKKRGCHMAYVDTFSFQAVGFYQGLGYSEYGHLAGFAHQHTRYYLAKELA